MPQSTTRLTLIDELRVRLAEIAPVFEQRARVMCAAHNDTTLEEDIRGGAQIDAHKTELDDALLRRRVERQRSLADIRETFERDIVARDAAARTDIAQRLAAFTAELTPGASVLKEDPETMRLQAKLAFLAKQAEDQAAQHRRKIERLDNEVTVLEKQ
jgi:hypothetical protein